jgi:hypothetical protein
MGYKQLPLFPADEMEKLKAPLIVEWEMFVKKTAGATYSETDGAASQSGKKKRRKKRSNDK